jgi:signal transduction histidine kinase
LRLVLDEVAAGVGDAVPQIERANTQLDRTLAELGELARGLHPHALVEDGLGEALRMLAADSALPVDLSLSSGRLPRDLEPAVYFVCAEAIANAVKYAAASRVDVRVTVDGATVLAEIADDGIGGADRSRGTGLTGLADRVEALGGRLSLRSPRGEGTVLSAELPLS